MFCGAVNPRKKELLQAMPCFTVTKQSIGRLVVQELPLVWLNGSQKENYKWETLLFTKV